MTPRITTIEIDLPIVPVTGGIPQAVTNYLPSPNTGSIPTPRVDVPSFDIPSFDPIIVTPSDIPQIPRVNTNNSETKDPIEEPRAGLSSPAPSALPLPSAPTVPHAPTPLSAERPRVGAAPDLEIPFIGSVPVPRSRELVLAGTTAFAATGAALVGKSLLDYLIRALKPVFKRAFLTTKKLLNKDLTEYETQLLFALDTDAKNKSITRVLKKQQKQERERQYRQAEQAKHQNKPERKESRDGSEPQP